MTKELWKTVIHSEENLRDVMCHFVDDYLKLKNVCEQYDDDGNPDDATWVHVDVAREEREELEQEVDKLKDALHKRNEEYNDLYKLFRALEKDYHNLVCEHREQQRDVTPTTKTKLKRKKPKKIEVKYEALDDDDLPF